MKTAEVIRFYGTQAAAARALNIKQPSVALWGDYPPDQRQLQIQRLTKGALKAEPECEARLLGLPLRRSTDKAGA